MANDKEVIQKLLKIAENQQKIITKLAQMGASPTGASSTWDDVSDDIAAKLATIPAAKGYSVESAEAGSQSGSLRGKLITPKDDPNFYSVLKALKNQLIGKTVRTGDGKEVQLSSNPQDVSFVGSWGY